VRGNVQARFGGEGLVFLGNQDPASYPTLVVRNTLQGRLVGKLCFFDNFPPYFAFFVSLFSA
jgi:hypothetical protein